ncbi:MAG: hypothetical protein HXY45_05915 [Syntrophaceae bacterium]|nr:hypothetical protein [Syntrophaceae bacterium]
MTHTVLQFTLVEFDEHWTRAGSVLYTATDKAQLAVIVEGITGIKETYLFEVERGEVVLVSWDANLVYIPARCTKKETGDKTVYGRG